MVMLPRDEMAASIISPIRSGSMGVFCANQVRMTRRASPSPMKAVSSTTPSTSTWTNDRIEKYAMLPAYFSPSCSQQANDRRAGHPRQPMALQPAIDRGHDPGAEA